MAKRDEIIAFCDELLDIQAFADYGPNGLQVPGSDEVTVVASAVSAHRASIDAAIAMDADLLIAHHGLFWDFHPRALTDAMASRLKAAFGSGLSIAGYHLPLDAHPEIGNNVLLCRSLGFEPGPEPFGKSKGRPVGIVGHRPEPIQADRFLELVERELGRAPLVFADGPDRISSIGVITGAAASGIHEAIALGLDAFITGEPAEHVMADSREGDIHFISAGHYATEIAGINRLGELVAEKFSVRHTFLDIANPI